MHSAADGQPDAVLLAAVRTGDLSAFGVLFRRHAAAAHVAARRWTAQPTERQDLVADAFVRTLNAIRRGAGPRNSFRPYLLTAVHNLSITALRDRRRINLYGTAREFDAVARDPGIDDTVHESVSRRWTVQLVLSAFRTLPPRWRMVLWCQEVQGLSPSELAPRLGMSANGVAALAMRAREGLRQAYLQAQVPHPGSTGCAAVRRQLGSWTRSGLPARRTQLVTDHLAACADCRLVATALAEVNRDLHATARGGVGPRH